MKATILLSAIYLLSQQVIAQKFELNIHAGTSNYVGELFFKESKLPEYNLSNARLAGGLGLEYAVWDKFSLRSTFLMGTIGADDKKTGIDPARNLNFTSRIYDLMIGGQYYLTHPDRYLISPYIFTGISFFHFNPYTKDRAGNKVYLQPLSTEGQGFVAGREAYKLYQVSIPYGGGFKINLNENIRIGAELSLRKTFTDYLDDVSTTYVDRELLLTNRGQRAVDMAYRGDEISGDAGYPAAGTERGIDKFKDRYYFSSVSFSFRLNNGSSVRGSKVRCPGRM